MTSLAKKLGLGLMIVASTQVDASAASQASGLEPAKPPPAKGHATRARPPAPAALQDRITALGRGFDGKAGIAVVAVGEGWEADWNATSLFPQQSCSKLWVAITALDAVDHGRLNLDTRVPLSRSDLTLFHQPLAARILNGSVQSITLGELLFNAITQSDNTANDKLLR